MSFNIVSKLHDALTAQADAMARLDAARDAWHGGAATQFAQAQARHTELQRKLAAAEDAAAHAETTFKTEFAAAGYEHTAAVRNALTSKHDALAMADELRGALAQCTQDMATHARAASFNGRSYLQTYNAAYVAHVRAEAYLAIQEVGAKIARAMAMAAHTPSMQADHQMPAGLWSPDVRKTEDAASWSFVWEALQAMARQQPEYDNRPAVDALGALDFSALPPAQWLSPGQIHKLERSADIARP